jgi:hypothetical protein
MHVTAADYFNISKMDLLDPVVILFLESLAEEIYKISGEIDNLESRVSDKLSSILVPNADAIAQPAHTLLHVSPEDTRLNITTTTGFYHSLKSNRKKMFFYPVCNTQICKGDVKYYIHNGTIYSINKDQTRTRLTRSVKNKPQRENTFWIGLKLSEDIDNLSDLSFYMNLQGIPKKETYLNLLPYTVWKIQDETIPMNKGLFAINEKNENENLDFFSSYDLSQMINNTVKNQYDNRFLTITGNFDITDKREFFPEKLRDIFSSDITANFSEPLIWIEVTCPQIFTSEILDNMQVSINVFPVVNKRLVYKSVEIKSYLPFIPLNTNNEESFISVFSLSDSGGMPYYDVPVNNIRSGIYSLLRGSCERYKTRDAQEYIASLVDLLNGEISGFFKSKSDTGNDLKSIEDAAREMIKQLRQVSADTKNRQEIENYICIDTAEDGIFFVKYWMTNGSDANNIPAGTVLFSENIQAKRDSVIILSETYGGKPAPLATEKNNFYRKSLSENKLLVTNEDIKNFCMKNFSDYFNDIQVRKGLMKNKNPKAGFICTTDVYMNHRKELKKHTGGLDTTFFEQVLRENSPATFTYRVFITNKE